MKPERELCKDIQTCYDLLAGFSSKPEVVRAAYDNAEYFKRLGKHGSWLWNKDKLERGLKNAFTRYNDFGAPVELLPLHLQQKYWTWLQSRLDAEKVSNNTSYARYLQAEKPWKDTPVMGGVSEANVLNSLEKTMGEEIKEERLSFTGKIKEKLENFSEENPRLVRGLEVAGTVGIGLLIPFVAIFGGSAHIDNAIKKPSNLENKLDLSKSKRDIQEIKNGSDIYISDSYFYEPQGEHPWEPRIKKLTLNEIIQDIYSGEILKHYFIDGFLSVTLNTSSVSSAYIILKRTGGTIAHHVPEKIALKEWDEHPSDTSKTYLYCYVECYTLKDEYKRVLLNAFSGGSSLVKKFVEFVDKTPRVFVDKVQVNNNTYDVDDLELKSEKMVLQDNAEYAITKLILKQPLSYVDMLCLLGTNPALGMVSFLEFILGSPADLNVYNGGFKNSDLGIYSGKSAEPEFVIIPTSSDRNWNPAMPDPTSYNLEVVGVSKGAFTLRTNVVKSNAIAQSAEVKDTISSGQKISYKPEEKNGKLTLVKSSSPSAGGSDLGNTLCYVGAGSAAGAIPIGVYVANRRKKKQLATQRATLRRARQVESEEIVTAEVVSPPLEEE